MTTLIHQRVQLAREGKNPTVIARLRSGWVVLGDIQVVDGYCLLLPDPVVSDLNALATESRFEFLEDMSIVGDALLAVTGADRINYAILGNTDPALHAHIIPRYRSEPEAYRKQPVWFYDWEEARPFDENRDRALMDQLRDAMVAKNKSDS